MDTNLSVDDAKKIGVYMIHNQELGVGYIGSGILGSRFKTHEYLLRKGDHWNYKLQRAFNENPNFSFVAIPIEVGTEEQNREVALELEQSEINDYWGPCLLNIAKDVEKPMTGYKHTQEAKDKNGQATAERWQNPDWRQSVITAQNAGKAAMTDEEKAARAAAVSTGLKAVYDSGERESTKGQVRSEEFCEQNSAKIKDKWQDPDYRARQIASRQGKTNEKTRIPVMGDGVEYPSKMAAAEALGISKQSITYRLQSETYPGWFETAR